MNFIKTSIRAIGKLLTIMALAAAFLAGMVGVVYLSLRGDEVKVPEVVGKDYYESEKEMESLGLRLKRRATRYSEEKPNTVLEQLPKPGETVKTGQTILVVLSEANPEGNEAPATIKKEDPVDDTEESTDITPEKPKMNKNSNVKKPSQTTRDVIGNKSNKNSNSNSSGGNPGDSKSSSNDTNKGNKNDSPTPTSKPTPANKPTPSSPAKTEPAKPAAAKTPGSGETRTRKIP